jgi:putative endonuclease
MKDSTYYIYILTSYKNTVLYTGMTSNLWKRVAEHRQELVDGFTKRYNVQKLVYYEVAEDLDGALYREKQIKGYSRQKKINLIESVNPEWKDLFNNLTD